MYSEIICNGERIITDDPEAYGEYELVCTHEELPSDTLEAMASPEHVAKMHALKTLESAIILSGFPLQHGILKREADALGISLQSLAEQVAAKADEQIQFELARRVYKVNNLEE